MQRPRMVNLYWAVPDGYSKVKGELYFVHQTGAEG